MIKDIVASVGVCVVVGLLLYAYRNSSYYKKNSDGENNKNKKLCTDENEIETILSMPHFRKSLTGIDHILSNPKNTSETYYIEYDCSLFNHLTHGIIALYRIGCEISNIETFMEEYKTKLKTPNEYIKQYEKKYNHIPILDVEDSVTDKEYPTMQQFIKGHLGKRFNTYGIYRKFERDLINNQNNNLNGLVKKWFPQLSNGVGGSAFHGIIHLGYGISAQNKEMILDGLSHCVHSYVPFGTVSNENDGVDNKEDNNNATQENKLQLIDVLNKIRNDKELQNVIALNINKPEFASVELPLFGKKMILLSKLSQPLISKYCQLLKPLLYNFTSKEDICKWLLENSILLYNYSEIEQKNYHEFNDFFLLHGVTSCYALTEILLSVDFSLKECQTMAYHYLNALIGCWIAQEMPLLQINHNGESNDDILEMKSNMASIIKQNILMKENNFDDEHTYKLIQVVLECLSQNIISVQAANEAIIKSFKPFTFDPLRDTKDN
jgi:hypothetical protein